MKILMIGEFSGYFNCLKAGFERLGHTVFLASAGDGIKDYPSDFRWDSHLHLGRLQPFYNYANLLLHLPKLTGYDVVLFISPRLFGRHSRTNKPVYSFLMKHNKLSYVVGTGLYNYSFKYWYEKKDSKYYGYTSAYIRAAKNEKERLHYCSPEGLEWEEFIMPKFTGIIPIWYEYAQPYRDFPNLKKTIRTPVEIDKFEYTPNILRDGKVVFFHGLSRPCKGGEFILAAFDRLREKHKDDAEFIAAGGLPFDEYMKIIERANVVVDDANSYSFCMNAFFSMLKGKIVMGGAEVEGNRELGYKDVPVVNIKADVNQICEAIEKIIAQKDHLEEWGLKSRKFVEKYHDCEAVAQQFIEQFQRDLPDK